MMLYNLQRNFGLYWYPEWYLRIYEQTIGFKGRHKDKLWIKFKDEGDGFQADAVCDSGCTCSFVYCNDYILDSKIYIFVISERAIWLLKRLNT